MKKWLALLLVLAFIIPLSALAAEKKPVNEWPILLEVNGKNIDCVWEDATYIQVFETNIGGVVLNFKDITKMVIIEGHPRFGSSVNVEITLKNGDVLTGGYTQKCWLKIVSPLYGKIEITKYPVTIYFNGQVSSAPSSVSSKIDKIVLKNGDSVSGIILTDTFKLKTSYGELEFKSKDIKTINLEGGGNNVDVVMLRVGDKMSGVIINTHIKIRMTNGTEIVIEKDKVKEIIFKE